MIALEHTRHAFGASDENSWALQRTLVDDLARYWQRRDHGLWEIRGKRRNFTHSRVMVWAAFDRAVRAVEEYDLPGEVDKWRKLRDAVRDEVLEKGFDAERNTFTQHYETTEVDASLLVLPLVGFIDGDDPRMLGTIAAIEEDLIRDGLVMRYRTETGVDGLKGGEHPFLACSFWLVSAYVAAGRRDGRRAALRRAGRPGQRRGAALGGVRRHEPADGRQLPAGVQPPRARDGGLRPRRALTPPGNAAGRVSHSAPSRAGLRAVSGKEEVRRRRSPVESPTTRQIGCEDPRSRRPELRAALGAGRGGRPPP